MLIKFIKGLFCNHEWIKISFQSFWWSGDWSRNGIEYYSCRCSKCGRRKVVPFEISIDSFIDNPNRRTDDESIR